MGVASALIAQFGFFGKKCLKNVFYKSFCPAKVVTNQNLQLLCYVTFFDILHHYGVIAASQICRVSRKYCAVLQNRFLLSRLAIRSIEKVLHLPKKVNFQILMNLHILRATEYKKVIFGMSRVCVCVCVCGHYNSKNNWASSTKFGIWSYMIKISVGIAYEQNRPTGVASALRAQFGFWAKCLKNSLHKKKSVKSCYKSQYATSGVKTFLIAPRVWPLPWRHNSVFWWKVP